MTAIERAGIVETEPGVEGNARLTGTAGAALFALLALEGVTIVRVRELVRVHVFVGIVIGAFVVTKLASVGYRFARYYLGDPAYVRKGAPARALRIAGPFVVATTVAVVATGIATLAAGRDTRWLLGAHKASFALWIVAMTVHVVGHLLDTPKLAVADFRPAAGSAAVRGTWLRRLVTFATLVTGLVLGSVVVSSGWMSAWHHLTQR